jgi:YVTN family beta-propeller protein
VNAPQQASPPTNFFATGLSSLLGLAALSDVQHVYIANAGDNNVKVIQTPNNTVTAKISVATTSARSKNVNVVNTSTHHNWDCRSRIFFLWLGDQD